MTNGNKTLNIDCRYLSKPDFPALHQTFHDAFSDYFVPFQLSEEQLENHIRQNSVDLVRSVGAFSNDQLVGFTLNGFGVWNGKQTVYDAGTGIIPAYRNRGIGKAMFDFMMSDLMKNGFEQILLEVITHNKTAVRLYQKLGFETTRRLIFFEQNNSFEFEPKINFDVREISAPDWQLFESFAGGKTSWQNSFAAISLTLPKRLVLGAFIDEKCIGYGIVSRGGAVISQLAVAKNYRRNGAGSLILREMQTRLEKKLRVSNVDEKITSAVEFLKKLGFTETLVQLEMIKTL